MSSIFINCTRHPSGRWGAPQREAAEKLGPIVDIFFPEVDPAASAEEVRQQAFELLEQLNRIASGHDVAWIHLMGEQSIVGAMMRDVACEGDGKTPCLRFVVTTHRRAMVGEAGKDVWRWGFVQFREVL